MNALRSASVVLCVCCVATSVISVLIPSGRMKKIINLVLGLFLICSMIIPIFGFISTASSDFNIEENPLNISTPDEYLYEKEVLKRTADNLVLVANDMLSNENIECENIEIGLKKSDNNSIYISCINIYISNDMIEKTEDIKKIIRINMMKEPVVIVGES